ncbi:integrase [Thioalkalivibrio paradoxus ARh 1]|uniref:Integrase n=1 Tax=Thioalkalivibrio paradoxus ARh 1 TaxID=713585 RepID=W0DJU2_9GAMM|nr:integrase [Thioalkalivibrio paradoxus ARh 1]
MQAGHDVLALQFRMVGDDLIHRHARPHEVQHHFDRPAHVSNTRLAVADLHVQGDATQLCHRGCALVQLRVNDVALGGEVQTRASVVQQKTREPVRFELTAFEETHRSNAYAVFLGAKSEIS